MNLDIKTTKWIKYMPTPLNHSITVEGLYECLKRIDAPNLLLIQFSAPWCGPCRSIQSLCHEKILDLPDNVHTIQLDIDAHMDLYMFLKKKKMLKGIPSLLVWYPCEDRDMDVWYIPSDSVLSSNLSDVNAFFVRCKEKAKQLCK
jgi:thiol-disulfide isomerase/thioredoxin